MVIRELWHTSTEKSEIFSKDFETNDPSKILIKTSYSLVSTGTERIVSLGKVPSQIEQLMKVPGMEGSFSFPVKYGYSIVGEVIDGEKSWIGKQVHLMHPHQDFAYVSPNQVSIIPDGVPVIRASLASLMETAVNAVWDSGVSIGDTVLINGFGTVGALLSYVLSQIPGVNLAVNEISSERRQIAESMGFKVLKNGEKAEFDLSFNATAKSDGLQFCLDHTSYEGTIVELSWFGDTAAELKLGGNFHIRRQRIISSQVSNIPGSRLNRWNYKRRKDLVFNLLENPVFDNLLKYQVPFSKAPETFDLIRKGSINDICITFNYQ